MPDNKRSIDMSVCLHTGKPLPDNLVNDNRKRPNVYRYRRPDGTYKYIRKPYAQACLLAEMANSKREASPMSSKSTLYWCGQYIEWMESQNPELLAKRGWVDRKAMLRKFAGEFPVLREATLANLSTWWDALTYDQQHSRRSVLSQFFQWCMSKGVAKQNPFNTSDALPHLIEKKKPAKRRRPINNMAEFNAIYEHAEDYVQVAMMISLTTTMRAGDVAALRFSDVVDTPQGKKLCRTIAKSANQRGAMAATHGGWNLSRHVKLAQAINHGRKLAMMRPDSPPYIVNKRPQRRRIRAGCDNVYQVTSKDLSRGFTNAVAAAGLWENLKDATPPTFHEVRGLAIDLLLKSGIDIKQVQRLAAHTDESITSGYTAQHPPEFVDLGIVVSDEVLK